MNLGKLAFFVIRLSFLALPAHAISVKPNGFPGFTPDFTPSVFIATFDNLLFTGGETINGSFTYNNDPVCCKVISGSVTAIGGIFTEENIVWPATDISVSEDGISLHLHRTKNISLLILNSVVHDGESMKPGDFDISYAFILNPDPGTVASYFTSGTITITEVQNHVTPESLTILGVGTAIAFGTSFKRKLDKIKKVYSL